MAQNFQFLSLSLLLALNIIQVSCSITIPLISANSPESPFYIKNLTRQQRIQQTIDRTKCISSSRKPINSTQLETNSRHEVCIRPTAMLLKIRVGTFQSPIPYKTYFLLMDTGSDLIWLQCEDCKNNPPNKCFGNPPITFPNSESSTFKPIPCGTNELCSHDCKDGFCSYEVLYADNSKIMGFLASERFALGNDNPRRNDEAQETVFNLVFGCNLFGEGTFGSTGEVGLLGLGWGSRSFISQLRTLTDDVFSYCLPLYLETFSGAQGYLNLGLDANFDPRAFTTIALRRYGNFPAYYLNLHGISVLGRDLKIEPSIFVKRGNTGGTIIDSGAVLSKIVREAYEVLKTELIAYFESQGGYYRTNPEPGDFNYDLCFKTKGHSIDEFPSITLNFEGGDMVLEPINLYEWLDVTPNTFCLTIMPNDKGYTALGHFQQSNFHIVHDRKNFLLHFRKENCRLHA